MARYVLSKNVVAMTGKPTVIEVPAGAVVDGPPTLSRRGTVMVVWRGEPLTILATDLLDSARLVAGEAE